MADVSYIVQSKGQGEVVTALKKFVVVQATVSKDDTITISELTTIESARAYALDDAAHVDMSAATNVLTVIEDPCASEKVVILVVGS